MTVPPWQCQGWLVKASVRAHDLLKNWRLRHVSLSLYDGAPELCWRTDPQEGRLSKRTMRLDASAKVVLTSSFELHVHTGRYTLKLRGVQENDETSMRSCLDRWKDRIEQAISWLDPKATSLGEPPGTNITEPETSDERYQEARAARASVLSLLGTDASTRDLCPTYAVALDTALKLPRMRSHEELLKEGLLVEWQPDMGSLLFISQ